MTTPTHVQIKLPVSFKKERKWVVASCWPLDLHTQGPTQKEAEACLLEALQLFLEVYFKNVTGRECGPDEQIEVKY